MTKQIDEILSLVDDVVTAYIRNHGIADAKDILKSALEAALKPGEPVGYRYKFRNFMGDEVWSFELPRDGKVLEAVPVYLEPMPTWQPSDAFRNDAHIAFLHGVIEGQKTAPPAQTPCGYDETTGNCTNNPCCRATPPAQTPVPPRLTDEQVISAYKAGSIEWKEETDSWSFRVGAKWAQDTIRKQAGWE